MGFGIDHKGHKVHKVRGFGFGNVTAKNAKGVKKFEDGRWWIAVFHYPFSILNSQRPCPSCQTSRSTSKRLKRAYSISRWRKFASAIRSCCARLSRRFVPLRERRFLAF